MTIQLKFDYYFFMKIKYGNDDVEKIKANSNCTDKSKQITLRPSLIYILQQKTNTHKFTSQNQFEKCSLQKYLL